MGCCGIMSAFGGGYIGTVWFNSGIAVSVGVAAVSLDLAAGVVAVDVLLLLLVSTWTLEVVLFDVWSHAVWLTAQLAPCPVGVPLSPAVAAVPLVAGVPKAFVWLLVLLSTTDESWYGFQVV